jgi:hypothetical protein
MSCLEETGASVDFEVLAKGLLGEESENSWRRRKWKHYRFSLATDGVTPLETGTRGGANAGYLRRLFLGGGEGPGCKGESEVDEAVLGEEQNMMFSISTDSCLLSVT